MHWPIRRTLIFSLGILEKNNDECILILLIYWKRTGLLRTKISNHNNLFIIETQKIVIIATKIIFTDVFTRCIANRCTGIYKFGNKYLPSAYKMQFEFRPHFSGGKVRFIGREIWYLPE
jgi:hypothetical protein